MRKQVSAAPIRRLSDIVEEKLTHCFDATIEGATDPTYITTLKGYIDEAYEILVFTGKQTIMVKGWLKTKTGEKLPIIMAQRDNELDSNVMYCLLPKSENDYYEYTKPKLVTE